MDRREDSKIYMVYVVFTVCLFSTSALLHAASPPTSLTTEQEMLEEREAGDEMIEAEPMVLPSDIQTAIDLLPQDTTPRYTINEIRLTGNTLFTEDELHQYSNEYTEYNSTHCHPWVTRIMAAE